MADQELYDGGLTSGVLINWQSFVDCRLANTWQSPFTDAVIDAYTR